MKKIIAVFGLTLALAACGDNNTSTDSSTTGDSTVPSMEPATQSTGTTDSSATGVDTPGDTRGMKGTGVDNTGGTPGPGTITDTLGGQVDTADHTSKRKP